MRKHILTNEQIQLLRFCFKLRIVEMKKGTLTHEIYMASGKFEDDISEIYIEGIIDSHTYQKINEIFRDELILACYSSVMED